MSYLGGSILLHVYIIMELSTSSASWESRTLEKLMQYSRSPVSEVTARSELNVLCRFLFLVFGCQFFK